MVAFRANTISKIFIAVAKKLLFVKERGEGVLSGWDRTPTRQTGETRYLLEWERQAMACV